MLPNSITCEILHQAKCKDKVEEDSLKLRICALPADLAGWDNASVHNSRAISVALHSYIRHVASQLNNNDAWILNKCSRAVASETLHRLHLFYAQNKKLT